MSDAGYTSNDQNIVIYRGGSFSKLCTLTAPAPNTATFKAALRRYPDSRYAEQISMTAELVLGDLKKVKVSLTADQTSSLDFQNERYYWDVWMELPNDEISRVAGGRAVLVPLIAEAAEET